MSYTVYAQLTPPGKTYEPGVHKCPDARTARRAGHTVIDHRGRSYEAVPMTGTLNAAKRFGSAAISIRNYTAQEFALISGVLGRLPDAHLRLFASSYNGIVCVDWTGQNWDSPTRPGNTTVLGAGTNMSRSVTRGTVTETGRRIELTHSCLHELRAPPFGRRGMFTLWHELGHFAYNNRLIPRTVARSNYGTSMHTGPSEQPAYAYMWYYLEPARLAPADRTAFD
ncbi:MAG TPA: hypothetical protein VFH61_14805, partial [Thermoleophilia bacterium]|nr:hypothetical protein [Thermoleophilia bacterium]